MTSLFKAPKGGTPAAVQAPTQIKVPSAADPKVKAAARQRQRKDENDRKGRGSTNLSSATYSRTRLG